MTKMTISPRFFKLGAFGSGMGHRYVQNNVHSSFIPPFVCMTHWKIILGQLKSFGFMDTCGIFNLHGIPGIIAFICGAISITTYDSELSNLPFALNSFNKWYWIWVLSSQQCRCAPKREHLNASLMWWLVFPYGFILVVSTPQSQRSSYGPVVHAGLSLFFLLLFP